MTRLRRSDTSAPGVTRQRCGRGFTYRAPDGRRVTDPATIERYRALAIPPAWTDVWICPWPNGHIQAMGTDDRGRRQYRYHDEWRRRRDAEKFDHMIVFGRALGPLRATVDEHLRERGFTRNRVLAGAVRLLELGFFRIGSEGYAEENNTFGLATMRRRHVTISGDEVTFDYTAKGGKRRVQSVVDADVARLVRGLKARHGGGHELLAYREGARWVDVKSADINAYLKEHTGEEVSAKDFRTWHATVLCAVALARNGCGAAPAARKKAIGTVVREVADYLGNTPAVCRSSYIDPRVLDRFRTGVTVEIADAHDDPVRLRHAAEAALLDLLAEEGDARPAAA